MMISQAAHCDIAEVRTLPWKEEIESGFHIYSQNRLSLVLRFPPPLMHLS